ncbi:hypothetical protein [Altererythrobacter sp.]
MQAVGSHTSMRYPRFGNSATVKPFFAMPHRNTGAIRAANGLIV